MGGDIIRREPIAHKQILEDALVFPIFTRVGWIDYFLKLKKFDDDITKRSTATLQYDGAIVKGLSIDASEGAIAQISGLPKIGAEFPTWANAMVAREEFYEWMECGINDRLAHGLKWSEIYKRCKLKW